MATACTGCGQLNRDGARFCDQCGESIAAAIGEGERRQVTVMFCDLVGSVKLSERTDPEDLREIIRSLQRVARKPIEEFGGTIAQYLGDGLLIYFGYPRAHEDDPERAVLAALAIHAALPGLNADLAKRGLSSAIELHTSVHTGLVVIADMGAGEHRETLAMGETVNVAARLLDVAEAGEIVTSDETRRLLGADFELEEVGERSLRGLSAPVNSFRVLGAQRAVRAESFATPLVGRDREMEELARHWQAACSGSRQAVAVSGEPGIGKTRLLASFLREVESQGGAWRELRCSRFHAGTAFHPFIVAIEQELDLAANAPEDDVADALSSWVTGVGQRPEEGVELLAGLLALPPPSRYATRSDGPEARRRRTLEMLCAWVRAGAAREPLVQVIEDLHWADPSTLEVIGRLLAEKGDAPLLLVLTHRPSFQPTWEAEALHGIALRPLERWQTETLVEALVGTRPFSASLRARLVERTDGIPLFIEELTRALLETEPGNVMPEIPSTLQGSLMARIDNLGPARKLAQLAAVIGREFQHNLLAAVAVGQDVNLERDLGELLASGLVRRDPTGVDRYVFKHALIQETAYRSQVRDQRRAHHARVVKALAEGFPERVAAQPEMMAHHCEAAGLADEAVEHFTRAGKQAIERSAHAEALGHLRRALGLVEAMPEGPERSAREVSLLVLLGSPIVALQGWGHPEIEATQTRARELSRELGPGPELYQALGALYMYYGPRGDLDRAGEIGDQLMEIGRSVEEPFVLQMGEGFRGLVDFYRGSLDSAWQRSKRMLAREGKAEPPDWYIHDVYPGVLARACGSMALALLGRTDEAHALAHDAVALGRASRNRFNHGFALCFAGLALHSCGDSEGLLALGQEGVRVCSEEGYPTLIGLAAALEGCAMAALGRPREGAKRVEEGLALGSRARALVEGPRVLGLLAESQRAAGEAGAARDSALAGVRVGTTHGIHFWKAELLRLAADIALENDLLADPGEAASDLRTALELARRQGAVLFEARIRETLARYKIESV